MRNVCAYFLAHANSFASTVKMGNVRDMASSLSRVRALAVPALLLPLLLVSSVSGRNQPLPLPQPQLPPPPPLMPAVVTSGGQLRLLNDVQVRVVYDAAGNLLTVEPTGWWLINYPLEQIEGLHDRSADEIAQLLLGRPAAEVRNWYVRTPGAAPPEPAPPSRPAPVRPSATVAASGADLVVDAVHPAADDGNPGTPQRPLRTISAAMGRAGAGDLVHIHPAVYRETITLHTDENRQPDQPIRLHGIPDEEGRLPVVSGNDEFAPQAWEPVQELAGVYRADLFTGLPGTVSADGRTLIERNHPGELREDEYCINRGSQEFLNLRFEGADPPGGGQEDFGRQWRRHAADDEGFVDLGAIFGADAQEAVIWMSSWLWVEPPDDLEDHRPPAYRARIDEGFRAARQTGTDLQQQVNPYRAWVNGDLVPAMTYITTPDTPGPRAERNWGTTDRWLDFPLRPGWNHLLLQLDTTVRPANLRLRFQLDQEKPAIISSAAGPAQPEARPPGAPQRWCTEYLVLDPFAGEQSDNGVYVRLAGDADPGGAVMDLSRRGTLLDIQADFVEVRGLEFRHGAQFQQRAQVLLNGAGILLEGCIIRDSEVRGITIEPRRDQHAPPIIIRNNWIMNPGNTGIGGSSTSEHLTAENQDETAPGRTRVLIEHNTIINANWAGHEPLWESGGIKLFCLTGSVIRHNTIVGGYGPGIWLDWEHYGNRIEGNRLVNTWGFGVGIEASPGPNLVASNLCIGLRPGPVWFRGGILSWDSTRTWMLHNTVDGQSDPTRGWQGYVGAEGLRRGYRAERGTRWSPLPHMDLIYALNLVLGCERPIRHDPSDTALWNFSDIESPATAAMPHRMLRHPEQGDYRPIAAPADLPRAGDVAPAAHVIHDYFGLLRRPDHPAEPGAFRHEPLPPENITTHVEVEYIDGTLRLD
jgi:hypothetical protein